MATSEGLADADRIDHVFTNLLTNALKFTDPGGKVTISAATEEEFVRFIVKDTGVGIPQPRRLSACPSRMRPNVARSASFMRSGLVVNEVASVRLAQRRTALPRVSPSSALRGPPLRSRLPGPR